MVLSKCVYGGRSLIPEITMQIISHGKILYYKSHQHHCFLHFPAQVSSNLLYMKISVDPGYMNNGKI